MGMIQAQNFGAAKLALAMRLKCPSMEKAVSLVEEALDRGSIIRTHVMRPTWQLVEYRLLKAKQEDEANN